MKPNSSGRLSGGCLILWGLKVAAIVDLSTQPMTFRYLTRSAPPNLDSKWEIRFLYRSIPQILIMWWGVNTAGSETSPSRPPAPLPHLSGDQTGSLRARARACVLFSITADPWQRCGRISPSTSGRLKYRYTNIIFSGTAEEIHCFLSPSIQRWTSLYKLIFSIHG